MRTPGNLLPKYARPSSCTTTSTAPIPARTARRPRSSDLAPYLPRLPKLAAGRDNLALDDQVVMDPAVGLAAGDNYPAEGWRYYFNTGGFIVTPVRSSRATTRFGMINSKVPPDRTPSKCKRPAKVLRTFKLAASKRDTSAPGASTAVFGATVGSRPDFVSPTTSSPH